MVLMIGTPGFGWFSNNNNVWSVDEYFFPREKRILWESSKEDFSG